jgi:hypothetical protein
MYLARPTIAVLGIGGSLAALTSTRWECFHALPTNQRWRVRMLAGWDHLLSGNGVSRPHRDDWADANRIR